MQCLSENAVCIPSVLRTEVHEAQNVHVCLCTCMDIHAVIPPELVQEMPA